MAFDSADPPRLYFNREGETDVEAGGDNFVSARNLEELLSWRLPMGRKSRYIDLMIELRGMDYESVVFPGLEIVYAESGEVR